MTTKEQIERIIFELPPSDSHKKGRNLEVPDFARKRQPKIMMCPFCTEYLYDIQPWCSFCQHEKVWI
jgi:hypothetical protein